MTARDQAALRLFRRLRAGCAAPATSAQLSKTSPRRSPLTSVSLRVGLFPSFASTLFCHHRSFISAGRKRKVVRGAAGACVCPERLPESEWCWGIAVAHSGGRALWWDSGGRGDEPRGGVMSAAEVGPEVSPAIGSVHLPPLRVQPVCCFSENLGKRTSLSRKGTPEPRCPSMSPFSAATWESTFPMFPNNPAGVTYSISSFQPPLLIQRKAISHDSIMLITCVTVKSVILRTRRNSSHNREPGLKSGAVGRGANESLNSSLNSRRLF